MASRKRLASRKDDRLTIGLDLGDKTSRYGVLESDGEMALEDRVATTRAGLIEKCRGLPPCRIAIEVGGHSPWVSRLLTGMGHEVIGLPGTFPVLFVSIAFRPPKSPPLPKPPWVRLDR